jgi:predicted transcriptional regulator of viral defense system
MRIEALRKQANREIIDYIFLMSALSDYASPRDKVSEWLDKGDLIRVKKGLYVFGGNAAQHPFSLEVLANLIYGPSALSLEFALSFYGFIPERVTTITSITPKRNKEFSTPVGDFTYTYLSPKKYAVGIDLVTTASTSMLIASPEKALCDYLYIRNKNSKMQTKDEIEKFLLEDLRVDENNIHALDINAMEEIVNVYQHEKLDLLLEWIRKKV